MRPGKRPARARYTRGAAQPLHRGLARLQNSPATQAPGRRLTISPGAGREIRDRASRAGRLGTLPDASA